MDKYDFFIYNKQFFEEKIKYNISQTLDKMYKGTYCWIWQKYCNPDGYGVVGGPNKSTFRTHRLTYCIFKGPLTEGLEIDHLCRNRACCNPDHLEEVTHQENSRRGEIGLGIKEKEMVKTHCAHGHEYTEANTKYQKVKNPDGSFRYKRQCRECSKLYQRKLKENNPRVKAWAPRSERCDKVYLDPEVQAKLDAEREELRKKKNSSTNQ